MPLPLSTVHRPTPIVNSVTMRVRMTPPVIRNPRILALAASASPVYHSSTRSCAASRDCSAGRAASALAAMVRSSPRAPPFSASTAAISALAVAQVARSDAPKASRNASQASCHAATQEPAAAFRTNAATMAGSTRRRLARVMPYSPSNRVVHAPTRAAWRCMYGSGSGDLALGRSAGSSASACSRSSRSDRAAVTRKAHRRQSRLSCTPSIDITLAGALNMCNAAAPIGPFRVQSASAWNTASCRAMYRIPPAGSAILPTRNRPA
ncbi:hypothetical protein DFJ74DRAFT_664042 [Hyaloraphidium curvatum]|nr:hypothetical protein DFJ74DRAFT_664042 [Hyaloraphidium curvatum]